MCEFKDGFNNARKVGMLPERCIGYDGTPGDGDGLLDAIAPRFEIKWRDQTYGTKKYEKWEPISEAKMMEMLKRLSAADVDMFRARLARGEEVGNSRYVLRDETKQNLPELWTGWDEEPD